MANDTMLVKNALQKVKVKFLDCDMVEANVFGKDLGLGIRVIDGVILMGQSYLFIENINDNDVFIQKDTLVAEAYDREVIYTIADDTLIEEDHNIEVIKDEGIKDILARKWCESST